jgi:hypothetical protein
LRFTLAKGPDSETLLSLLRLVKLREAYKVQEAREAGRDEGRIEASLSPLRNLLNHISLTTLAQPLAGLSGDRTMDEQPSYPRRTDGLPKPRRPSSGS